MKYPATFIAPKGFDIRCLLEADDAGEDPMDIGATVNCPSCKAVANPNAGPFCPKCGSKLDEDDDEEAGDPTYGLTKSGPGTGALTSDLTPDSPEWPKTTTRIKTPARGREASNEVRKGKTRLQISTPFRGFTIERESNADPLRESLAKITDDADKLQDAARQMRGRIMPPTFVPDPIDEG